MNNEHEHARKEEARPLPATRAEVAGRILAGLDADPRFDSGLSPSASPEDRLRVQSLGLVRRSPLIPGLHALSPAQAAVDILRRDSFEAPMPERDASDTFDKAQAPVLEEAQKYLRELDEQPRDIPDDDRPPAEVSL
jgi:hypothetical protein